MARRCRLREIGTPALDRALRRLRPEQHVAVRSVVLFACQGARVIGQRRGMGREIGQVCSVSHARESMCAERASECIQRIFDLMPRDGLRRPIVRQQQQRLARELYRVLDTGDRCGAGNRSADPFTTSVGDRDQMGCEVAAVHRRDIRRIERTQVASVIPVIEVTAEALHLLHRRQRRFQPLDGCTRCRSSRNRAR